MKNVRVPRAEKEAGRESLGKISVPRFRKEAGQLHHKSSTLKVNIPIRDTITCQ